MPLLAADYPDPLLVPVGNFGIQAFHDRVLKNRVTSSSLKPNLCMTERLNMTLSC